MIFNEMTRPELNVVDKNAIVVLPLGSTEQHGLHLPVNTDTKTVEAISRELEHRLPDKVLLAPTNWLGHSPHHLEFGGTISLNYNIYSAMLIEIIECFRAMGYQKILMLNGHGGNGMPMSIAQQEMKLRDPKLMLCACNYWELARNEILSIREGGKYAMGHACEMETSLYMFLDEANVRKSEIRDAGWTFNENYFGYGMFNGGPVSYLANFNEISDTGAFGAPSFASYEKGEKLFSVISNALKAFVIDFYNIEKMFEEK